MAKQEKDILITSNDINNHLIIMKTIYSHKFQTYILFLVIFFLVKIDLLGQIKWRPIAERENYYDTIKISRNYYIDAEPDTLIFKGEIYFFRQTPLSLKKKYTDVFHRGEVVIDILEYPGYNRVGVKGYTLTWIIKNDSLFIKNISPEYLYVDVIKEDGSIEKNEDGSFKTEPIYGYLHTDTIISRVEKFTGSKFKNGLLYMDWVTGDFGVITSYIAPRLEPKDRTGHYRDSREEGFIITFKNGKFVKFEEDKRKHKN
ncbi:MAG: hypothetical protein LBT51_00960 [Fusobacteriaceae bacterium]|nr:hypothetical protein [Fusobacteriaceae bacterium]